MTEAELREGLEYIANSPAPEYGGFHPKAVETARAALAWMNQARELLDRWMREAHEAENGLRKDTDAFLTGEKR